MNNVFVDEAINENSSERDTQKQCLGGNPCFEKLVFTTCENNKTKVEIEKTCRYATILYSLMSEFRYVFPDDLPNSLSLSREVDHLIEVIPRSKLVTKPAYRLSRSKA